MKTKLFPGVALYRRVRLIWADFQHVRHNANRPLGGIKRYSDGSASFTLQRSTMGYAEACDRLPNLLRKLAVATALKPNTKLGCAEDSFGEP